MTRVLSLSVVTLLVLSFVAYGFPGKYYGKHGKHGWWSDSEILEKLKLTDQQKSKIDEIVSANKEKIEKLRTQVKTEYEAFRGVMKDPNSTRDQILSKFDQVGKTQGELRRAEFEMALDMRDVLTPEQRTTLYEMKEKRMERYKKDREDR